MREAQRDRERNERGRGGKLYMMKAKSVDKSTTRVL